MPIYKIYLSIPYQAVAEPSSVPLLHACLPPPPQPDALFVVVPALALPTKAAAVAYCSMFVIGTVLAMGGYTLLIGGWPGG